MYTVRDNSKGHRPCYLQIIDFATFIEKIAILQEGAATVWRPNVRHAGALRRIPLQTVAQATA